jgi:ssDNA-binding Zn-finger/Zn-ribbon topoisomerase 1
MKAQVAAKTEIARASCHACGGPVVVKANKNGLAYYFCPNFDHETEAVCNHHEKWGRSRSDRMLNRYLTKRAPDKAANTNAAPKGEYDEYGFE